MKIPDRTRIQSIDLKVRDLKISLDFYKEQIGLKEIERGEDFVLLSASGEFPYLIKLTEDSDAPVRQKGTPGLFHLALLFPNKKELARVFLRLFNNKIKFQGFADHLVSEAIYLADPEGNGIELYVDKPKEVWERKFGEVIMDTLPLDLSRITNELDAGESEVRDGIHPDTMVGHIHLNVSDLGKAEEVYNDILGLSISNSSYPGAKFFAAGDYHHHIGTNTWSAKRGALINKNSAGMTGYKIEFSDNDFLKLIEQRAKDSNLLIKPFDGTELIIKDFDENKITLVN